MSDPRITLDQWRALAAVVERGSYARAAEALHKSQSTVTYAVQQIESLLAVKTFEIRGRKAVLTPTGELLYRRARYLLDEAAAIEQSARRLSAGWEAEIRLAVEVLFPTWLLLACLARFGEESAHTRIEVVEAVIGDRTDALTDGRADLAIFPRVPPGYAGEPLMRLRFVLAAHPGHPLHHLGRPATMRDLRAHRHLVVRESGAARDTALSMEVTQRWTFSQLATSIEAARAGYGFAWLPEERIRAELEGGTLAPVALRDGSERFADLYLIHADAEHVGPGTLRLAQMLREGVASECSRHVPGAAPGGAAVRAPQPRRRVRSA